MLMKFSKLLQRELASNPGEQQRQAVKQFRVAVESSRFKPWALKNVGSETGKRLVMGIATYVPAELALLDDINERLCNGSGSIGVEVFNVLDCANQNDVNIRVPGIACAHQTPIVALWQDGEFCQSEQGAKARELLQRLFD